MNQNAISVCVPTWNRFDFTTKCFEQVLQDDRVCEIVINDDNSSDGSFEKLCEYYKDFPKVRLFRNSERLKVHGNKHQSIYKSASDWCILLDSDNIIDKSYLDIIFAKEWNNEVIFQPEFAMPNFDYRHLTGKYDKHNIKEHITAPLFECMLNTQNFFVNSANYLNVWEDEKDINGADSIFFNYLWLRNGYSIEVVSGLQYEHTVHRGSFYESVAEESLPKSLNITEKIKQL